MKKFGNPKLEKYLRSYAKGIIRMAKSLIKRKKKVDTGKLLRSLKYTLNHSKNGYTIDFKGSKHAEFIDKGVRGKGGSVLPDGSKHKSTGGRRTYVDVDGKRKNSPYRFKNKYPRLSAIEAFTKRKGMTDRSAAFLVSRSIYARGIQGISFYSQPIGATRNKFMKQLVQEFGKDVLDKLTMKGKTI